MPLTFNWKYWQKGLDSCDNGYFGYGLDCCERLLFANITNITTKKTFDLYSLQDAGWLTLKCATDKRQYLSDEILWCKRQNYGINVRRSTRPVHAKLLWCYVSVTKTTLSLTSVYSIHGTLTAEASLDEVESHGRHYKRIASSTYPRVHYECERCILARNIAPRRSYAWKVEWNKNTVLLVTSLLITAHLPYGGCCWWRCF